MLAEQVGESHEQIRKYIRLTHLIPDILELVDNSVLREPEVLQIAMRPAVELSYLRKEEQADLFAIMEEMDCTALHPMPRQSKCGRCPKPRPVMSGLPKMPLSPL